MVVVGAGLAGLVAAISARRAIDRTTRIVVFAGSQLGGRARCDEHDGYVFNRGPRALSRGGPAETALVELGVDVSHGGPPFVDEAFFWDAGRFHPAPSTIRRLITTPLLNGRDRPRAARFLATLRKLDPSAHRGQSVSEALRSIGFDTRGRQLIEALVRVSTYVNDPDHLDAEAALTNVRTAYTTGVRYLDGGWQTLVDQLVDIAWHDNVTIVDDNALRVESGADGRSTVIGARHHIVAESLILAAGSPRACAGLLDEAPSSWPLDAPSSRASCLELGLSSLPRRRLAIGIDEPLYFSTHAPPARLAPPDGAVVHVMMYRPPHDATPARDIKARLEDYARQVGVDDDAIVTARFLPQMTPVTAVPTVDQGGLLGRPRTAVDGMPGVFVAGDWVGPEGMLADATIASAVSAGRLAAGRVARTSSHARLSTTMHDDGEPRDDDVAKTTSATGVGDTAMAAAADRRSTLRSCWKPSDQADAY